MEATLASWSAVSKVVQVRSWDWSTFQWRRACRVSDLRPSRSSGSCVRVRSLWRKAVRLSPHPQHAGRRLGHQPVCRRADLAAGGSQGTKETAPAAPAVAERRVDGSCIRLRPQRLNQVWSYDFVEDTIHNGRKCQMLNSARACRADQPGEHLLTHLRDDRLEVPVLRKVGQNSSNRASRRSLELNI